MTDQQQQERAGPAGSTRKGQGGAHLTVPAVGTGAGDVEVPVRCGWVWGVAGGGKDGDLWAGGGQEAA